MPFFDDNTLCPRFADPVGERLANVAQAGSQIQPITVVCGLKSLGKPQWLYSRVKRLNYGGYLANLPNHGDDRAST